MMIPLRMLIANVCTNAVGHYGFILREHAVRSSCFPFSKLSCIPRLRRWVSNGFSWGMMLHDVVVSLISWCSISIRIPHTLFRRSLTLVILRGLWLLVLINKPYLFWRKRNAMKDLYSLELEHLPGTFAWNICLLACKLAALAAPSVSDVHCVCQCILCILWLEPL